MEKKKLPISKRSVLIASALVLAIGLPIAYLLWSDAQEDAGAWYSSSWLYRRSISVANSGSELTNEDVLIVYDTAALVTAGKLQSDCDDLRFVDSDDSTALAYWVEGGCNTSTTHIWVRIPSLPNGGKTIYMYYGNSSATNAEETWTGKFYLMKNSACDSGWTTESNSGGDFYQKFPYPSSSFGTTGGASSHDHGNYNRTTSTVSTGSNTNTSGTNSVSIAHSHDVTLITETNSSVLPPYLDMIFCSHNDLIVESSMVTVFTSTVPSGFVRFSSLDSLFPRGNSSYGGTSTTTTHTHTITASTTGSPSATGTNATGGTNIPSGTHTHSFSADVTGDGTHVPTYMTVIYGQADADIMTPTSTIVMSNATPPLGWTRYSSLDGYFPYGSTSYGTTGGTSTHTHSIPSLTSGTPSGSVTGSTANPKSSLPNMTHTHTTTTTTSTEYSNNPPYIQTVFVQKKTSQSATVNNEEVNNTAPNAPSSLLAEGATNPTAVIDTTPEFSAVFTDDDTSDTGTYYEIEVNTQSDFLGTSMWDTGQLSTGPITNGDRSSDFSYDGLTLTLNGTTYYWRIRFWDNNSAVSNWSSTANFTMDTSNTTPNAPSSLQTEGLTNPAKVTDTTPEFSAIFSDTDTGDTGINYEIEVNTNNSFTGTVMWDSNKTSITAITNGSRSSDIPYNGTTLSADGTTYYWRMKFWDQDDAESSWSSTAQFTMSGPPNAPTSLLAEGSTNPTGVTDLTPEFSAIYSDPNSDNGTYYEIEVNTNDTFTGTVMWDSNQQATGPITSGNRSSDISYAGNTLSLNGTTYYWRVRMWDSDDLVSNWSSTGNFTMYSNSSPNAPSTLYTETVANPTKVIDTTPEFSAIFSDVDGSDTGNYYEIEVNTNDSFTGTVMWDSDQTEIGPITNGQRSSDIPYAGTTLTLDGITYYWRMRFWDNNGAVSNWSSTAQFTMSGLPNTPTSLLTEGSTNPTSVMDITPEFSAIYSDPNSDNGTHYEIEVNTNDTFTGTVMWDSNQQATGPITSGDRSSDISYAGTTLTLDEITYYWRVRFWDSDGYVSNWSSTANFTMGTNTTPYAPSTPYTEGSSNPTKVTDLTPEFSAVFSDPDASNTGIFYEIEVNTNNTFTGTVMWDSSKTSITAITNGSRSSNISYAGTALTLDSSTYYWRIRFWDNYEYVSNWSTTQSFTMQGPPNEPSTLKVDGMQNPTYILSLTPSFTTLHSDSNGDNATYYEIEVNTNDSFTGTVMWDSGKTAMTSTPSGSYTPDIVYDGTELTGTSETILYWRIRLWDSDDYVSLWSSTGSFLDYIVSEEYIQFNNLGLEGIKIN